MGNNNRQGEEASPKLILNKAKAPQPQHYAPIEESVYHDAPLNGLTESAQYKNNNNSSQSKMDNMTRDTSGFAVKTDANNSILEKRSS
jgi:hypothetical protein